MYEYTNTMDEKGMKSGVMMKQANIKDECSHSIVVYVIENRIEKEE